MDTNKVFESSMNLSRLIFSPSSLLMQISSEEKFCVRSSLPLENDADIEFLFADAGIVNLEPQTLTIPAHNTSCQTATVVALLAKATFFIDANCSQNTTSCPFERSRRRVVQLLQIFSLSQSFLRLQIVHSLPLNVLIQIFGWIYFVAWSISFYPQIYLNFKRKSVIGLNFDFLGLNLTGFLFYALFNCAMFWVPVVEGEYLERHPRGLNPVQTNDVFFALHATFATIVTIVQCFIYERGNQKVSYTARCLLALDWCICLVCLIVTVSSPKSLNWLGFFNILSYIKLSITLIKYIPQAFYNYRRKSTTGWSIGNVLLDFTGGATSVLQMLLLAYNSDDYAEIFGDPTKFGLGLLSLIFDLLFMFQHYVLYRSPIHYESLLSEAPPTEPIVIAADEPEE